jgi:plastocyanin
MEGREQQAREGIGDRASARRRWLVLASASAAVLGLAVTAAPAGGGVVAGGNVGDAVVTATPANRFDPPMVSINQGETVTWNNGGGLHDVVFEDGFRYPPMAPSRDPWSFSRTFNDPGTYRYYCSVHRPVGMEGEVSVNAVPPPPGTPPPGSPPPPGTPPPGGPPPPGGTPPPGGGTPPGGSPGAPSGGKASTTVTLQVSDRTPARGQRVRFFGSVRPEQDGRLVQLQRRARGGSYRTVVRIKLQDAGANRSKFSRRLRMLRDGVFRARLPADSDHKQGTSRTTRVDVR